MHPHTYTYTHHHSHLFKQLLNLSPPHTPERLSANTPQASGLKPPIIHPTPPPHPTPHQRSPLAYQTSHDIPFMFSSLPSGEVARVGPENIQHYTAQFNAPELWRDVVSIAIEQASFLQHEVG